MLGDSLLNANAKPAAESVPLSEEDTARSEMTVGGSRKEIAERFKKCQYPSVMFSMLDGRDYSDQVWRMVKPSGKAFRCDSDV